ncbi:MAG TPA: hypothetical protein VG367_18280 [Mucilaginibacter sp.]|jgi:hypothetical protein|nr:hypothetical protein [Mucilaginibacter sp.]
MASPAFPSLLTPTDCEVISFNGQTIELPKTIITFKQWKGVSIAYTFGGKPLIDFDGIPVFAELAIMKLFKISGWQARWIETCGSPDKNPFHFSDWDPTKLKLTEQNRDMIQDDSILKLLDAISILNSKTYGYSYSGCWDVVGWRGDKILFAESKRTNKDRFRETQHKWLSAGMMSGLDSNNFLVVEWDFI